MPADIDWSQLYSLGLSYFNQILAVISSYVGIDLTQGGSILAISTGGLFVILFAVLILRRFGGTILSILTFLILAELARRFFGSSLYS